MIFNVLIKREVTLEIHEDIFIYFKYFEFRESIKTIKTRD